MSYHFMEQNKYKKSIKKLGKISIYEFRKSKTSFAHSLVLNMIKWIHKEMMDMLFCGKLESIVHRRIGKTRMETII